MMLNMMTRLSLDNCKPMTNVVSLFVRPVNMVKCENMVAAPNTKNIMADVVAVSIKIEYRSENLPADFARVS